MTPKKNRHEQRHVEAKDNVPHAVKAHRAPSRYWVWTGLMIIFLFTAGVRIRLLSVPLERDEGEYAYAGQLILQGIPPYAQAYNMKMPGIYAGIHRVLFTGSAFSGERTTSPIQMTPMFTI